MADNWRLEAECNGQGDAFYPETGRSKNEALAICRGCVVREKCLDYALENKEQWGIWGGMTAKDRRKLLRFKDQLNGVVFTNPRANAKKSKRSGFKIA